MGWFDRFRRLERTSWFICYNCLGRNAHKAVEAIFSYSGPPEMINGRGWVKCPRCDNINTRSFQQLKDEGSDPQLWGLEQIVRSQPRERFPVKPPPA